MKVLIDRDMIYVQRADGVRLGKQLTIATSGYELDLEDTFFKEADSFIKDYEIANNPPTPLDLAKKRLEELAMGKVEYPYSTKPEKYTQVDHLPLLTQILELDDVEISEINELNAVREQAKDQKFKQFFNKVFEKNPNPSSSQIINELLNKKEEIEKMLDMPTKEQKKEAAIAELQRQAEFFEKLAKKQELNWGKS